MSDEMQRVIVPDASVILKWVLDADDEPGHAAAELLLARWRQSEVELRVPSLWRYEVGNVLALKRPLDAREALLALFDLGLPEVALDGPLASRSVELAQAHGITFYDAAYLAVAVAHHALLITADSKLLRRLPPDSPAAALETEDQNGER